MICELPRNVGDLNNAGLKRGARCTFNDTAEATKMEMNELHFLTPSQKYPTVLVLRLASISM